MGNEVNVTGGTMERHFLAHQELGATVGYVPVEADDPDEGVVIEQLV